MLYFLTGDIQTGKTRWLTRLITKLKDQNVEIYGVISPGIWKEHADPQSFEKLGINCVLYPGEKTLLFAKRSDLITPGEKSKLIDDNRKMKWAFFSETICEVNAHFEAIKNIAENMHNETTSSDKKRLLIIDEIGWLELEQNEGFYRATSLLESSQTYFNDAIVVVRESLLEDAIKRFEPQWGDSSKLYANDESMNIFIQAFEP